jgi:hypothetical protein
MGPRPPRDRWTRDILGSDGGEITILPRFSASEAAAERDFSERRGIVVPGRPDERLHDLSELESVIFEGERGSWAPRSEDPVKRFLKPRRTITQRATVPLCGGAAGREFSTKAGNLGSDGNRATRGRPAGDNPEVARPPAKTEGCA